MIDTSHRDILALCILDLLAATDDHYLTTCCDELCDFITNIDTNIFSLNDAIATIAAATLIDSTHAAHIRDAFRDNHSYEGI